MSILDKPLVKTERKLSKKAFLEMIKAKQFEDFNKELTLLKEKHKRARKSVTLMKSECFALIKKALEVEGNMLKIQDMCLLADVSRSGYYNWVKSEPARDKKDERDTKDFALIQDAYNYRGFPKGARSIHMHLLHRDEPVLMNVKKIERLMRKFNLKFELRGNGVNRRISQMAISGRTTPKFTMLDLPEASGRREKFFLLTAKHDFPNNREGFLVAIIDIFTKQVLASVLAARDTKDLIKSVLDDFIAKGAPKTAELIYEKDGKLDTVKVDKLYASEADRNFILDIAPFANDAPKEHFIGFARDEVYVQGYQISNDGGAAVEDWIDYYNKDRYVWDLGKLSPDEYDNFLVTGKSPFDNKVITRARRKE
ncbi:MAG: IS3 family transposase [Phascolarctobacterium sp.]|nr:IS3 family transposase [Phascolarctobacterium sp.]